MITANQEKLIAKLLEGRKLKEASEELGIGERTAQRWNKDAEFQQAYSEERQRQLNQSITAMQLKFDNAIETLDKHTKAVKTIPRDQIKAAEIIVDKVLQTAELTRRIADLEAKLEQQIQDMMYKVVYDLRKLTGPEREYLRGVDDRLRRENT